MYLLLRILVCISWRSRLSRKNVCGFFSHSWRTTFENSISWMGCCRTSYFKLICALCGAEIDSRISKFFQDGSNNKFHVLSAIQLSSINNLQRRTIAHEENLSTKMSSKLASLQQEIADMTVALIARKSSPDYKLNEEAIEAINKMEEATMCTIEEAHELSLKTYKELMKILTPAQALDFIIAN